MSAPAPPGDLERLLEFLRDRDVACPVCGYNLRNLTTPVCPECRHELSLSVDAADVRLAVFVAALAPGIFSGIMAVLLAIPIAWSFQAGVAGPPVPIWVALGFGLASGLLTLTLVARRGVFLRLAPPTQRSVALTNWLVHVAMFVGIVTKLAGWW